MRPGRSVRHDRGALKILGVDPGKTGALALLDSVDGKILELEDMPEAPGAISAIIRGWEPDVVVVEQVASRPNNSRPAAFTFGQFFGRIEEAASGSGVRLRRVTPTEWKRDMRLSSDKDLSRLRASERWPDWMLSFTRKSDDGRAEAALIAAWHIHHPG